MQRIRSPTTRRPQKTGGGDGRRISWPGEFSDPRVTRSDFQREADLDLLKVPYPRRTPRNLAAETGWPIRLTPTRRSGCSPGSNTILLLVWPGRLRDTRRRAHHAPRASVFERGELAPEALARTAQQSPISRSSRARRRGAPVAWDRGTAPRACGAEFLAGWCARAGSTARLAQRRGRGGAHGRGYADRCRGAARRGRGDRCRRRQHRGRVARDARRRSRHVAAARQRAAHEACFRGIRFRADLAALREHVLRATEPLATRCRRFAGDAAIVAVAALRPRSRRSSWSSRLPRAGSRASSSRAPSSTPGSRGWHISVSPSAAPSGLDPAADVIVAAWCVSSWRCCACAPSAYGFGARRRHGVALRMLAGQKIVDTVAFRGRASSGRRRSGRTAAVHARILVQSLVTRAFPSTSRFRPRPPFRPDRGPRRVRLEELSA